MGSVWTLLLIWIEIFHLVMAIYPMDNSLSEKKFYIYPLPQHNWYAFLNCTLFSEFRENGGYGRIVDYDRGYFNSWHHSLFYSFFMRLKYSKRRTMNPEDADLFIIPFDYTIKEIYVLSSAGTCVHRGKRQPCPKASADIRTFVEESKYFQKYGGVDHVMITSLTVPAFDCAAMKKQICQNCLSTGYFAFPPVLERIPRNFEASDMSGFVSLPFPSYYHWHTNVKFVPWEESRISERTTFATFVGNPRVLIVDHTRLRRTLISQCKKRNNPKTCNVVDMQPQSISNSSNKTNSRFQIQDLLPDLSAVMNAYTKSVFCFVPPGDDPTRKGIVDVIIAGCIPVVFHPLTLHAQYPFHMDEATAIAVSVYFPLASVIRRRKRKSFDVIEKLLAIPPHVIRKKQKKLATLAPRLTYATPPLELLNSLSDLGDDDERIMGSGLSNRWEPPFPDAASLSLDGMFSRVTRLRNGLSANIPEVNISFDTWVRLYNSTLI